MSNHPKFIPGGAESDDEEEYADGARCQPNKPSEVDISQKFGDVKIIPKLGYQAGLNKSDFDISLDTNADGW